MARITQSKPGFTLIEILVAMAIIAVILGLLFAGFNRALNFTRQSVDQQAVAAMGTAVSNFEAAFGFLPPLINDGEEMSVLPQEILAASGAIDDIGPVVNLSGNLAKCAVYNTNDDFDRQFLEAAGIPVAEANQRYSKFSLSAYLVGAMPETVDGRAGPGYAQPQRDGSFGSLDDRRYQFASGGGPALTDGLIETEGSQISLEQRYFDPVEYREHGQTVPADAASVAGVNDRIAVVDRNGKAFRYYVWRQPANPSLEQAIGTSPTNDPGFIPVVLLDPLLVDLRHNQGQSFDDIRLDQRGLVESNLNPAVLASRFAIVGAGENGVFGTEDMGDILEALGRDASEASGLTNEARIRLRQEAWDDNIVELGQ